MRLCTALLTLLLACFQSVGGVKPPPACSLVPVETSSSCDSSTVPVVSSEYSCCRSVSPASLIPRSYAPEIFQQQEGCLEVVLQLLANVHCAACTSDAISIHSSNSTIRICNDFLYHLSESCFSGKNAYLVLSGGAVLKSKLDEIEPRLDIVQQNCFSLPLNEYAVGPTNAVKAPQTIIIGSAAAASCLIALALTLRFVIFRGNNKDEFAKYRHSAASGTAMDILPPATPPLEKKFLPDGEGGEGEEEGDGSRYISPSARAIRVAEIRRSMWLWETQGRVSLFVCLIFTICFSVLLVAVRQYLPDSDSFILNGSAARSNTVIFIVIFICASTYFVVYRIWLKNLEKSGPLAEEAGERERERERWVDGARGAVFGGAESVVILTNINRRGKECETISAAVIDEAVKFELNFQKRVSGGRYGNLSGTYSVSPGFNFDEISSAAERILFWQSAMKWGRDTGGPSLYANSIFQLWSVSDLSQRGKLEIEKLRHTLRHAPREGAMNVGVVCFSSGAAARHFVVGWYRHRGRWGKRSEISFDNAVIVGSGGVASVLWSQCGRTKRERGLRNLGLGLVVAGSNLIVLIIFSLLVSFSIAPFNVNQFFGIGLTGVAPPGESYPEIQAVVMKALPSLWLFASSRFFGRRIRWWIEKFKTSVTREREDYAAFRWELGSLSGYAITPFYLLSTVTFSGWNVTTAGLLNTFNFYLQKLSNISGTFVSAQALSQTLTLSLTILVLSSPFLSYLFSRRISHKRVYPICIERRISYEVSSSMTSVVLIFFLIPIFPAVGLVGIAWGIFYILKQRLIVAVHIDGEFMLRGKLHPQLIKYFMISICIMPATFFAEIAVALNVSPPTDWLAPALVAFVIVSVAAVVASGKFLMWRSQPKECDTGCGYCTGEVTPLETAWSATDLVAEMRNLRNI